MSGTEALTATSNPPEKTHLLVVEDEPLIRQLFSTLLAVAGYSVAQADNGFAALEEIRRRRPALILSDLNMPRMTGFELLSVIRRRFPGIHVIAMSGAFQGDRSPTASLPTPFTRRADATSARSSRSLKRHSAPPRWRRLRACRCSPSPIPTSRFGSAAAARPLRGPTSCLPVRSACVPFPIARPRSTPWRSPARRVSSALCLIPRSRITPATLRLPHRKLLDPSLAIV